MSDLATQHRALLLKHARTHVRTNAEKIPAEDVSRELELVLSQLSADKDVEWSGVGMDAYLRSIVRHACGRAKRRRKLIEQVAAGDDLQAVSDDLAQLNRDLPEHPARPNESALAARQELDKVKALLAPRDALVFALLIEDGGAVEDVARTLTMPPFEVEEARNRIMTAAASAGISAQEERRGSR